MSKFGEFIPKSARSKASASTGSPGPPALDATSGLSSDRLSERPFSQADLEQYYGGFFPTPEWTDALQPVPRDSRANPQLTDILVKPLTRERIESLKQDAEPYLRVSPNDLIGMAPVRNRIAGNARVMPSTRIARCPDGDGETLTWRPDDPDKIWCPQGHTVDPFARYPQTGSIRITGPKGDEQDYPYHDAPDGKRIYLNGEFMDSLRVYYLIEAAKTLGILYHLTSEVAYAQRAAAILYDFARAVPHWPKTHRGRPGIAEGDRLRPVTEYPVYAGIWYDKYHTGTRHFCTLAEGYDFIVNTPVWDALDSSAPGKDARAWIENDLFLYSVKDAIQYDIHYPHPDAALSNYIPSQAAGFTLIGRGVGIPELVHYAYWKLRQLAEKTIMADYVFPESMSYGAMHIHGIARASEKGQGYADPPGFISSIDGGRFDNLDNAQELPVLRRAVETLATMVYPDGNYIQAHDTHHKMRQRKNTTPEETRPSTSAAGETRPLIYPAFGHACLARGEAPKGNQIQAHLHYSGNWGHDHDDMLNFILWSYKEEMISDIGYQLTYNGFSHIAAGHNLVVVDRNTQESVNAPGRLIGWHPAEDGVQVIEVSAPEVYPQCSAYRRTLFLIPIGEMDNLVLDIFDVEGGSIHEWMAQGSCMVEQALDVPVPTRYHADSYADDEVPFTPPAHREWEKQLHAQGLKPRDVNPWYGVFRNVHKGRVEGPFTATFRAENPDMPDVRLHMLLPTDGDLYTCTVPTLRQCWSNALQIEDHSLVEKFRMPKLVIRREGENLRSRFVGLWEPARGSMVVKEVKNLAPGHPELVAVEIRTIGGHTVQLFYSSDPSKCHQISNGMAFQGRYASVISQNKNKQITLYDCASFHNGDLELTLSPRPALPLEEVREREGDNAVLVLNGVWADIPEDRPLQFETPELVILSQNGGHQRAFPIQAVEREGNRTRLRCSRHPGFDYDSGVLREIATPFQVVEGKAEVRLLSRVWARSNVARKGVWEVLTTDAVTVGTHRVERSEKSPKTQR